MKAQFEEILSYMVHQMICNNPGCGLKFTVEVATECSLPVKLKCPHCVMGLLQPVQYSFLTGKVVIQRKLKVTR